MALCNRLLQFENLDLRGILGGYATDGGKRFQVQQLEEAPLLGGVYFFTVTPKCLLSCYDGFDRRFRD